MINLLDQTLVIRGFVQDDFCSEYIKNFEKRKIKITYESSPNAVTGKIQTSSGKTLQINHNDVTYQDINKRIELALQSWINHLEEKKIFNIHVLKKHLLFPHSIRLIKYEKGLYIHPHTDWDHFTHASVTINLNSDYTGGEFVFFNGKEKIFLGRGDALVFPADPFWVHEVLPVTEGARYSINTFIRSVPTEKFHKLLYDVNQYQNSDNRYRII